MKNIGILSSSAVKILSKIWVTNEITGTLNSPGRVLKHQVMTNGTVVQSYSTPNTFVNSHYTPIRFIGSVNGKKIGLLSEFRENNQYYELMNGYFYSDKTNNLQYLPLPTELENTVLGVYYPAYANYYYVTGFYVNGKFFIYKQNSTITSTDGLSFTVEQQSNFTPFIMKYLNGKYVALGQDGLNLAWSNDGVVWNDIYTLPNNGYYSRAIRDIAYRNGEYIFLGWAATQSAEVYQPPYYPHIMEYFSLFTTDFQTFTKVVHNNMPNRTTFSYNVKAYDNIFIAYPEGTWQVPEGEYPLKYSYDAINWIDSNYTPTHIVNGVYNNGAVGVDPKAYSSGMFYGVLNNYNGPSYIVISKDGVNWSEKPMPSGMARYDKFMGEETNYFI